MVKLVLKRIFEKGQISFELPNDIASQEAIRHELTKCKEKHNDFVLVTLEPPKKPRTTGEGSQNNLFWKLVQLICNVTGDTPEAIEADLKEKAIAKGYPYHVSKITGRPVGESMTKVSTVEMSYLIDTAYEVCAFLEINTQAGVI